METAESADREVLQQIFNGVAAVTGDAFFDALVKHLALALGVRCAWVTEWHAEENVLHSLAFWVEGRYVDEYDYDVRNTPCEAVVHRRELVVVPDRVIELFPEDPDLPPLGAVSYMGQPLLDAGGEVLGHLAVLHDRALHPSPTLDAVFRIFGARAEAELARARRDRALAASEERLSRLIDSALDSIVELDADLAVVRLNRAAEQTFGRRGAVLAGAPLSALLSAASCARVASLARGLAAAEEGGPASVWIADGLQGLRAGGETFPAEATLSRFEATGRSYYSLILRDLGERARAERRIRELSDEAAYLRAEIEQLSGPDEIVGESEPVRRMLADIRSVAASDTTVLISGETGTGKELIARAIHRLSPRRDKALVRVNCAAIAANLQESELFGHEKGAFTGAVQRRRGLFQVADGGTIFLDEVGEMPLDLQAKLLRVLQEGEFQPVGSTATVRVDVRVVAATNRDLARMAESGAFRLDLLYRLNVFPLQAPPLRERGDDVLLLAEAIVARLSRRLGRTVAPLGAAEKQRLRSYAWPGNVRELENVIERALITSADGSALNLARALPDETPRAAPRAALAPLSARAREESETVLTAAQMVELERENLRRALAQCGGKLSGAGGAAALLGVHPNTLASRLKSLGLR